MIFRIAKHARKEACLVALCGFGAAVLAGYFWLPAGLILGGLTAVALGFFRDPERSCDAGQQDIVAPADGKVVAVEQVESSPMFLEGPGFRIAIFMSLFDVHVNRAPCNGVVEFVQHERGRHRNAAREDAATKNARCYMGVTMDDGRRMLITQVAGLVARGIVCNCEKGTRLEQGQRFGMIKLGSRVEVLLPDPEQFQASVHVGDKVKAGVTILGRYA